MARPIRGQCLRLVKTELGLIVDGVDAADVLQEAVEQRVGVRVAADGEQRSKDVVEHLAPVGEHAERGVDVEDPRDLNPTCEQHRPPVRPRVSAWLPERIRLRYGTWPPVRRGQPGCG